MRQRTIWQFPVKMADAFAVTMPKGSEVVSVQMQRGTPVMWALVNDDPGPIEERRFAVHGTGHPVPADRTRHVGTFQEQGGAVVWHLFEVTR
jgi:hypothetical protein